MNNNILWPLSTLCVLLLTAFPLQALADNGDEDDLAMAYGDQSEVSIATGSKIPVARAPSVATVITADEIAASGYTNIDNVLEMVPGLHVSRILGPAYQAIYVMRGIGTQYNPEVLMLLNGQPMTSIYEGNRGDGWAGMSVEHIARIEVIRGPGSALYGADAFAGVINIVTKDSTQVAGTRVGVNAGSFNDREAWVEHGSKWGDLTFSGDLHVLHTLGSDAVITSDAQTANDKAFGTHASLAPGSVSNDYNGFDMHLDFGWHGWKLRGAQLQRNDMGSGAGIAGALDPSGTTTTHTTLVDLGYTRQVDHWEWATDANYYRRSAFSDLTLYPAGTSFFGNTFTNGMIGDPSKVENRGALSETGVYNGVHHRLRFGLGREESQISYVGESKNFSFVFNQLCKCYVPSPLGAMVNVSGTSQAYMQPHQRWLSYGYLQDEWSITHDLTLTAGLRQDRYSDFGATTNPRLALVWNAAYNITTKLLYGSAFRAPSFVELYAINNPVAQGNPDAKPEKIDTTEFAFDWQVRNTLQLGFNVFHYRIRDILNYVASSDPNSGTKVENTGAQYGNGFEVEGKWDAGKTLHFNANYAYQQSTDGETHHDSGIAPRNHVFVQGTWDFMESWALSSDINYVAGRQRQPGDTRSYKVPDYTTVDMSMRKSAANDRWSIQFTARNLFAADVREPSFAGNGVPDDLPMDGRTYMLQTLIHF